MTNYVVSNGQTQTGISLRYSYSPEQASYDSQEVQAGGTSVLTSVGQETRETVDSGGVAIGTSDNGGTFSVASGAKATNTTVTALGLMAEGDGVFAAMTVSGTATATTISGGNAQVLAGGVMNGVALSASNQGYYGFDTAVSTQSQAYGLSVGGAASGVVITSIGAEAVLSGGVTTGTLLDSGLEAVLNEGTTNATTVAGGSSDVSGIANNTVITGGSEYVAGLGVSNASAVSGSGVEIVQAEGTSNGATVSGGASITIDANGSANEAATGSYAGTGSGTASNLTLSSGGTASNAGLVTASGGAGSDAIAVVGSGTITNTGTISGPGVAIYSDAGGPVTITNSGTIQAGAAQNAITLNGGGTITNSGTILAGNDAISGVSDLVLQAGSVITGSVIGAAGSTLELAAPGGTLSGLGSQYAGFATVQVDQGQNWTLSGPSTLANGATLELGTGSGLVVTGGALTDSGAGTISFQGTSGLSLDASPTGLTVTGMAANDALILSNLAYAPTNTISKVGNVVTVSVVGGASDSITIAGAPGENFALSSVAGGATELTVKPVITGITSHPDGTGMLGAGNGITFDLTPNVALTTTTTNGLPFLTLNDGGTATYDETASTSTNLVFRTTVAAGQNTTDLQVTGLSIGNSTIVDAAGTPLDGTSAVSDTGIAIQTTPTPTPPVMVAPPAPTGLTLAAASDTGVAGDDITNLTTITITGTAQAGSTVNVYDGAGTTSVGSGLVGANGAFSIATSLLAGVNALTATATGTSGGVSPVSAGLSVTVENAAPVVNSLTAGASAAGTLATGASVSFTLTPSAAVSVNLAGGSPTLALNDGGIALYDGPASSSTALVFTTTVLAGQNVADLQVTGLSLGGALIQDAAGNTLGASGVPGLAGSNTGIAVQTTPPINTTPPAAPAGLALAAASDSGVAGDGITNVATPTLTGTALAGSIINVFDNGGTNSVGTAVVGANGSFSVAASLLAGGNTLTATATDTSGNVSAPSLGLGVTLETVAPTVTGLTTAASATGVLGAGASISFTLATSAPLSVNLAGGSPTLSLGDGGIALYNAQASTATSLVFQTTVLSGQNAYGLQVTGLSLGGAVITDVAGNSLDGSAVPTLSGSNTGLVIDTRPAEIVAPPGVATTPGASGGTVFTTASGGSNTVNITDSGNDVVNSRGTDTVFAGGGTDIVFASGSSANVLGGTGALIFVAGAGNYTAGGGLGSDTLYGGNGMSTLTGGGAANSIIVAGFGNTTLAGGLGSSSLMFGGFGANLFTGSDGGSDTMVGGNGANEFDLTRNDIAFGGANGPDTFLTGAGNTLVVEGSGTTSIIVGPGTTTDFAGTGADTYNIAKGVDGIADIVGFKAGDHLSLTNGFTQANASTALSTATTGSFGTTLHLTDGTTINLFGASITSSQVSVG